MRTTWTERGSDHRVDELRRRADWAAEARAEPPMGVSLGYWTEDRY